MTKYISKGKGYRLWRSSAVGTPTMTRQRKRAMARAAAWQNSSFPNIPQDDRGLIIRRARRDMALSWARRNWRKGEKA